MSLFTPSSFYFLPLIFIPSHLHLALALSVVPPMHLARHIIAPYHDRWSGPLPGFGYISYLDRTSDRSQYSKRSGMHSHELKNALLLYRYCEYFNNPEDILRTYTQYTYRGEGVPSILHEAHYKQPQRLWTCWPEASLEHRGASSSLRTCISASIADSELND